MPPPLSTTHLAASQVSITLSGLDSHSTATSDEEDEATDELASDELASDELASDELASDEEATDELASDEDETDEATELGADEATELATDEATELATDEATELAADEATELALEEEATEDDELDFLSSSSSLPQAVSTILSASTMDNCFSIWKSPDWNHIIGWDGQCVALVYLHY